MVNARACQEGKTTVFLCKTKTSRVLQMQAREILTLSYSDVIHGNKHPNRSGLRGFFGLAGKSRLQDRL